MQIHPSKIITAISFPDSPTSLPFNCLCGPFRSALLVSSFVLLFFDYLDHISTMAAPRLFRPTARLFSSRLASTALRSNLRQSACAPALRRGYATENGTKEVTVRDALNEALAEELELNQKTFILGEEVAQYNGA